MGVPRAIFSLFLLLVRSHDVIFAKEYEWDENGYILFCPCMGRFGNQAEHFLGALEFAKDLNRTLAIPPWRTYVRQRNVPFSEWFKVEAVQEYHKSLPLEDFLLAFGEERWPAEKRIGYCYSHRKPSEEGCEMKKGNPFGPFWDELGVDFVGSEYIVTSYRTEDRRILKEWHDKYPPSEHPVIAMKGAPAAFPMNKNHRHLQKYLQWSDAIMAQVEEYIQGTLGGEPYIAVHLRIGTDWARACEHAVGTDSFMESQQCLEDHKGAKITQELCLPSLDQIAADIKAVVDATGIRSIFLASDSDPNTNSLQEKTGSEVKLFHLNPHLPQLDLALMGHADHFIGNCVSSFTAFVKRERDVNNLPSTFFGLDSIRSNRRKNEL